ncbi:MAG: PHP-associated domain-containing protein [Spirochaetales bacterium]|nr:PHP-associated domain-containing protein [Spirochaetales bacterium]
MKIDLHYHTILTKKAPFSREYLEDSAAAARKAGLDGMVMSDHFNSPDYDRIHPFMRDTYTRKGDAYLVNDFPLFPAIEVDVAEGPHVVLVMKSEKLDELTELLAPHWKDHVKTETLLEWGRERDALILCAHPFRPGREMTRIDSSLYGGFDAIGLNGRDIYYLGRELIGRTEALGEETGLPVAGGSDTHQPLQAGCLWNRFPRDIYTVEELRRAVKNREHAVEVSDCLEVRVEGAGTIKKLLKEKLVPTPVL